MITEQDLQEAIAECEGQRNPNASTCIKLAAFYTIKEHLFGNAEDNGGLKQEVYSYSSSSPPRETVIDCSEPDTEFCKAIQGMSVSDLVALTDEIMSTLSVIQPRLYDSIMRKLI